MLDVYSIEVLDQQVYINGRFEHPGYFAYDAHSCTDVGADLTCGAGFEVAA